MFICSYLLSNNNYSKIVKDYLAACKGAVWIYTAQ